MKFSCHCHLVCLIILWEEIITTSLISAIFLKENSENEKRSRLYTLPKREMF